MEWNNTRLTRLQMCGERFRRHDVEGDPEPSNPRLVRGSVVHAVAKTVLRRKLDHGGANEALPTLEETRDLAADMFEQTWSAEDVRLTDPDEDGTGLAAAKAEAKDFAVAVAGHHRLALAPRLRPIAIERRIVVKPRDSDLVIHGTLDVITRPEHVPDVGPVFGSRNIGDHHDDTAVAPGTPAPGDTIRDLKTSEKSPNRNAADRSQQLSMYAMIRQAEVGKLAEALALDYLVRTPKRGELKHVELTTVRDGNDLRALINRINIAVEGVKRGVFIPADPAMAWWCSRKWCGYWDTCPYVNGRQPPPREA